MRSTRTAALWMILISLMTASARGAEPKTIEFPADARIAFIGNTLVERDVQQGYFETLLISALPEKTITFRNLGWSGDNVRCDSRSGFGQSADGMAHLAKHVMEFKPNMVLLTDFSGTIRPVLALGMVTCRSGVRRSTG